jgi:hypothetical protein
MHIFKGNQIGILALSAILVSVFCAAAEQKKDDSIENNRISARSTIEALQIELTSMKSEYESRIKKLESRLEELQVQMQTMPSETSAVVPPPAAVPQTMAGALNPAISVVGNLVGRADSQKIFTEDGNRIDNKMILREAEIDMRVPVDPYADGVLITSLESDTMGKFTVGVEEGYVNIKKLPFLDRPPLGLKLKVGRFRPVFGTVNVLHTHDLPQTFRPLPIQEFLGPEGFIKDGISANFFIPTPWENSSLDLTLDAVTGGDIAVSPNPDSRMSYLGHLRYYGAFKNAHTVQLGWSSYFQPKGTTANEANIHGIDFLYRWKPARMGEWRSFILGGEFIFGRKAFPEAAESPDVARAIQGLQPGQGKPSGFYVFAQSQFNRRTYAGVRWDRTDVLFDPALQRRSLTPYVSYYFSEFLRFRLNYEHRWSDLFTEDRRNSVYGELNFVFGSHPTEPFWVNK